MNLVCFLLLGQWALGWKITQVRTMELNVKDPISNPCLFVLCLSYTIIPSSPLHCDDNLQCLHLRSYWKQQMMIQNNVFPVEGPQSAHGPISEEITCSTARLKMSSMCNAELLLNNCPLAMYSIVGWEHCFFRIRAWPTTDMTWWFSVAALGHEHLNALCIFFDVPSFQRNLGNGVLSLIRKQNWEIAFGVT